MSTEQPNHSQQSNALANSARYTESASLSDDAIDRIATHVAQILAAAQR